MSALNPIEVAQGASDAIDNLAGKKTPAQFIQVVAIILLGSMILLLAAILYGGYVAMTQNVPEHLDKIQQGFKIVATETADRYEKMRAAEIAADKERYEDHKKVDADRYEWIKEFAVKVKPLVGAAMPPDDDEPLVAKPSIGPPTN